MHSAPRGTVWENVADVGVKTMNFIQAKGFNYWCFSAFLSMDSEYRELLYNSKVRWLTCGIFALKNEIGLFLTMKGKVSKLNNLVFFLFCKFAFLTHLFGHLNILNLKLQGPRQVITMMYDGVKTFKCKLLWLVKKLTGGNFFAVIREC